MRQRIPGIHHVTAIAGDPQSNVDFYTGLLGLRMVKRTVNYDDPGTYHFYYGDDLGRPGTLLTFFPWPGAPQGRRGTGQATVTAFSVPAGSLGWWQNRLRTAGIAVEGPAARFEEEALTFEDPDGLRLELVAGARGDTRPGWEGGPVPADSAIRGFAGVTLSVQALEPTARMLETLGFRPTGEADDRFRFEAGDGGPGTVADVIAMPGEPRGRILAGTVHHVAWRAPDDTVQTAWREELARQGANVTPVVDRQYFRSIYFREPGGVLFEIATDAPGFTRDETPEQLGTGLRLPSWLEPQRGRIEQTLPPIHLPGARQEAAA